MDINNGVAWQVANPQVNFVKSRLMALEEHARVWMAISLVLTDMLSLYVCISISSVVRHLPGMNVDLSYDQVFGLLAVTLVALFYRRGLYPGVGINYVNELSQIASNTSFTFLIVFIITWMFRELSATLQVVLLISWVLSLGIIPAIRYVVRRLLIWLRLWGEPVVIIGDLVNAQSMVNHFTFNLQLGLRPVAILSDAQCATCALHCQALDPACVFNSYGLKYKTVLVMISDLNKIDELVERFRIIFHRVILVRNKYGRFGLSGMEALDFSDVMGLQVKNNLLSPESQLLKRTIDVLASFFGLLFLSPFLGLIALLVKLDSPGSIFYRQVRLGRNAQPFNFLKFRSMYQQADQLLLDAFKRDPALKAEWDLYQKLEKDPRITPIGRFLRRFSMDELPQLWNVLTARMSLVGPRPIMLNQREMYGEAFEEYTRVLPGMTGLWQVSGRNGTTFARRSELDNEYIQCWSIWLDIYIMVKTVKEVCWPTGAY